MEIGGQSDNLVGEGRGGPWAPSSTSAANRCRACGQAPSTVPPSPRGSSIPIPAWKGGFALMTERWPVVGGVKMGVREKVGGRRQHQPTYIRVALETFWHTAYSSNGVDEIFGEGG